MSSQFSGAEAGRWRVEAQSEPHVQALAQVNEQTQEEPGDSAFGETHLTQSLNTYFQGVVTKFPSQPALVHSSAASASLSGVHCLGVSVPYPCSGFSG